MHILNIFKFRIVKSLNPYRRDYTNSATSIRSRYGTVLVLFHSWMEDCSPPAWASLWSYNVRNFKLCPIAFTSSPLFNNCPSIISFPEEGYTTNLRKLELAGVNICKQVFEWGLHRLMSLTFLYIDGRSLWKSFPSEEEDGKMTTLPSSLTKLEIWNFPNIRFLSSKGFENLSALVDLRIGNCPKLAYLPKKRLPPSLLQLHIYECPSLKPYCKKRKGWEWLKIINIPFVEIALAEEAL